MLQAKRNRMIVFRFQVAIAFVGWAFVIKFGKGRQAESFVVGQEKLPAGTWSIGYIDTRIEAETMVDTGRHARH